MNRKHKALSVFLVIITFGFFLIALRKKRAVKENNIDENTNVDIKVGHLISLFGGKENIKNVESTLSKVKIYFNKKNLINVDELKKLKAVSGLVLSTSSISLIVGYGAKNLKDEILGVINGN
ncbi:hypothetical protein [Mycoplasma elephantis]|uniref:hypothetical protein n=1 Tax=Mycoplasma elephantis TaxID=114882 RepID=UPI0004821FC9|nr:hypothetical protein [Mycoplasma elephantis]